MQSLFKVLSDRTSNMQTFCGPKQKVTLFYDKFVINFFIVLFAEIRVEEMETRT